MKGRILKKKHLIGNVLMAGEYFDDFSTIPMDITGNGYLNYITGGWWGNTLAGAKTRRGRSRIGPSISSPRPATSRPRGRGMSMATGN